MSVATTDHLIVDFQHQPPRIGCSVCNSYKLLNVPKTLDQLKDELLLWHKRHKKCLKP